MITALEASRMSQTKSLQTVAIKPLEFLCRTITEAAVRGNFHIRTEGPLAPRDWEWLESNGYEVWIRKNYLKEYCLISWENAHE